MSFRRYRHRRWIAFIALFGLLFQQLAMAAYACPVDQAGMAADTAQVPPCHAPDGADKARCHQHCHPLIQSGDHAAAPTVPPALLPATTWLRNPAAERRPVASIATIVAARASAPPLTIQHCTFQI